MSNVLAMILLVVIETSSATIAMQWQISHDWFNNHRPDASHFIELFRALIEFESVRLTCECDNGIDCLKSIHVTISLHGGVVSEPLYV